MYMGVSCSMRSSPGLTLIVIGGCFFIFLLLNNPLIHPPFYTFPFIIFSLIVIIAGVFEIREYYNKILYFTVTTVLLVIMWIISYILLTTQSGDQIITTFNYMFLVGITLVIVLFAFKLVPIEWKNYIKILEYE